MKTLKKKSKGKSIKKYVDCKPKDIECKKKLVLELLRATPFPKNTSRKKPLVQLHTNAGEEGPPSYMSQRSKI